MTIETNSLLGQKVGHIRILDVLGEGGMGTVYAGFDDTLQRKVALKAVRPKHRLRAQIKARFLREARILSQVDHPHICRVFDYVEGEDNDFLILELVEGQTLRDRLRAGLERTQALAIAQQLLDVLEVVHGKSVIHRDFKPENIMLGKDDQVKVLDFGLARSLSKDEAVPVIAPDGDGGVTASTAGHSDHLTTKLGAIMGTLGYMSPEQAHGQQASTASDIYSFGLILQEILTGQQPYEEGLGQRELLFRVASAETRPVKGLPADLKAFIERLKSLAAVDRDLTVSLWDLDECTHRGFSCPKERDQSVALARDGDVIAFQDDDHLVISDAAFGGSRRLPFQGSDFSDLALSPDGDLAALSLWNRVVVWDQKVDSSRVVELPAEWREVYNELSYEPSTR